MQNSHLDSEIVHISLKIKSKLALYKLARKIFISKHNICFYYLIYANINHNVTCLSWFSSCFQWVNQIIYMKLLWYYSAFILRNISPKCFDRILKHEMMKLLSVIWGCFDLFYLAWVEKCFNSIFVWNKFFRQSKCNFRIFRD